MQLNVNVTSGRVVTAAMKVHSALGPGLLESAYKACLAHELRTRGSKVRVEVPIPVIYGAVRLGVGYKIDLLVDNTVIVELKTTRKIKPIHEAQLLSYLRLSGCKVGLLINFNVVRLRTGIKRMIN